MSVMDEYRLIVFMKECPDVTDTMYGVPTVDTCSYIG